MHFSHSPAIWSHHPGLSAAAIHVIGLGGPAPVIERAALYTDLARARLAEMPISDFPEIRAWRRTFAAMGLKPTQYRCAAESLLRRLRTHGNIPQVHPLVDLCNLVSARFAIPVGAFDLATVTGDLVVRPSDGTESYLSFGGGTENPTAGEIIFADDAGRAHARRWTHRQSAASAIRPGTNEALIVVEAMHEGAERDVEQLAGVLGGDIRELWGTQAKVGLLSAANPVFSAAP